MHSFFSFIKEFRLPKKQELLKIIKLFSKKQLYLFIGSLLVAFVSLIIVLAKINNHFLVDVPANGGTITEGVISMPTLVNPVLAVSDADKDVTSLVYSGLIRKNSDGTLIPDLAESYKVSPDKLTYTFILKKNIKFHDGKNVTTDDVEFTIKKIQDPLIKSPYQAKWAGVEISKINEQTIAFRLKQAYPSFIENTTIGILPMHIWNNLSNAEFMLSGLNIKGIGSGPYMIDSISKNGEGIPDVYTLKRFSSFALGAPHIKYIKIISYSNEQDLVKALRGGKINQAGGLSPKNAEALARDGFVIHTAVLPRMFGFFFNSNENKIFADKAVVSAFNYALDRKDIVDKVLFGYGSIIDNPIPKTVLLDQSIDQEGMVANIDKAKQILDDAGWTVKENGIRSKGGSTTVTTTSKVKGKIVKKTKTVSSGPLTELAFSLSTGDDPELSDTALLIKKEFEAIGARVEIKNYEIGTLNQLIRARKFEGLFFGQVINHESDLYAFWHSSQRADPGLNIALYSNPVIDGLLTSADKTSDSKELAKIYSQFITQFKKDLPALLIYSPEYLYATKPSLNNLLLNTITVPGDRFNGIYTWYTNSDRVWKIFTN